MSSKPLPDLEWCTVKFHLFFRLSWHSPHFSMRFLDGMYTDWTSELYVVHRLLPQVGRYLYTKLWWRRNWATNLPLLLLSVSLGCYKESVIKIFLTINDGTISSEYSQLMLPAILNFLMRDYCYLCTMCVLSCKNVPFPTSRILPTHPQISNKRIWK